MGKLLSRHFQKLYTNDFLPFLLPFLVFCAVLSWRPFWLGFYHDDWTTIASPPDLAEIFKDQMSRPIYAIIFGTFQFLLPRDPFVWQALLALMVTGSGILIGLLGYRIALLIVPDIAAAKWSAAVAAATWLAYPWTLGVTAWPTTLGAQFSIIGFCIVAIVLISSRPATTKLAYGPPIFLAISLISELFWFSFIPLLMIVAAGNYVREGAVRPRELNYLALTFGLVQLFLLFSNRILEWFGVGVSRSINPGWINTVSASLRSLPEEANKAVLWPNVFWGLAAIILLMIVAAIVFHPRRWLIASTMLAITSGVLGSVCLFALAGYQIASIGIFSRTTVVVSVWLALVPAIAVAASAKYNLYVRMLTLIAVVSLIVLFSGSSVVRLQGWITAWTHEQDMLRSFPGDDIAASATKDSFIVVVDSGPAGSIVGLGAFWDIAGALRTTYPKLGSLIAPDRRYTFATMANLETEQTVWDGHRLKQSWCANPADALWELAAPSDLYIWQYASRTLIHFTSPVSFGCGVPVPVR